MDYTKLSGVMPATVLAYLPDVATKFAIINPLRLSHFLAQTAHESGEFTHVVENLNYSSEGLMKIFPKYFTPETAMTYARQPEKIANRVYANRMGNGDEASGDGWKYRGAGYIQLTGKVNYSTLGLDIGKDLVEEPTLVTTPKYALSSAAWFFWKNGLNTIADTGDTDEVIKKITKRINGGQIGIEDRIVKFHKYYTLLK